MLRPSEQSNRPQGRIGRPRCWGLYGPAVGTGQLPPHASACAPHLAFTERATRPETFPRLTSRHSAVRADPAIAPSRRPRCCDRRRLGEGPAPARAVERLPAARSPLPGTQHPGADGVSPHNAIRERQAVSERQPRVAVVDVLVQRGERPRHPGRLSPNGMAPTAGGTLCPSTATPVPVAFVDRLRHLDVDSCGAAPE